MGFRFHRSKKLFPGLRLNFSKNGFGLSFGRKGMRYSIGPKGTRTTLGIPGTGLSYISTSSGTGGSSATGPVVSSAGVFSDIDCDADLLLGDPVFYDLGRMSDTHPKRAVMIYNSVVGFVKDDAERRIFRETGEIYRPSKGQLALERKLLNNWNRYRAYEYNKYRIDPFVYLLLAAFLGPLAVHRFAVQQIIEGVVRICILGFSVMYLPSVVWKLIWGVCLIEGVMTVAFAEREKNGRVVPLNILDVVSAFDSREE